jgi:hypothetical protein
MNDSGRFWLGAILVLIWAEYPNVMAWVAVHTSMWIATSAWAILTIIMLSYTWWYTKPRTRR